MITEKPAPRRCSTATPWGKADWSVVYRRGIVQYSTPGHGGVHVSPKLNAVMPDHLRINDGWYEHDSDMAKVILSFPDVFTEKQVADAAETLKNWDWRAYEIQYGVTLNPGESYKKDEYLFLEAHKDDLIVVSASTIYKTDLVRCIAVIGGNRENKVRKEFIVGKDEYAARNHFGFVIDPTKHKGYEEQMAEWAGQVARGH